MSSKPRVYIETSIIGYLVSRPSPHLHAASKQVYTADWWRDERGRYDVYASQAVVDEVSAGDPVAAAERLESLAGLDVLRITATALDLADLLMERTGLPLKAETDALHMAVATVHRMQFLLTWNCKHIANANLQPKIAETCESAGFTAPIMCTPMELQNG